MSLTTVVFLIAYAGGLALALLRDPKFGLYTYLAVFYLHPPSRWWGSVLPDLRWSLVAALVTLVATISRPSVKSLPGWYLATPAKLLIVFTVWLWIQNAWALSPDEHFGVSVLFTKYLVLLFLIHRLVDSTEEVGRFLFIHVVGCTYLGWLAYMESDVGRLEGVGWPGIDEANALGMFVASGLVCAGLLFLGDSSRRRWICLLALPFLVNTIVQSESRGAVLGAVAGGLSALYMSKQGLRMKLVAAAAAGLTVLLAVAPTVFWERMFTLRATVDEQADMDLSAQNRLVLIEAQFRMAAAYPFGAGHRGTAALSPRYLDERWLTRSGDDLWGAGARSSHNTLMSALVEQGVVGLVVFGWLLSWLLRTMMKVRGWWGLTYPGLVEIRLYAAAAAASLIVVFAAGMFTDYLKTEVQIWMMAVLSVLLRLQANRVAVTYSIASARGGVPPRSI